MGFDHGRDGVGALDGGGTPGRERTRIGLVVAGQVERDNPIPGLDKRFDEHRQMRALAAPTVHQIHRRPFAPFLPGDSVPIPVRFYRPSP